MDDNETNGPPIVLRMLGHDRQWQVVYQDRIVGQLPYFDIRDYLLGKRPKTELLERFQVQLD